MTYNYYISIKSLKNMSDVTPLFPTLQCLPLSSRFLTRVRGEEGFVPRDIWHWRHLAGSCWHLVGRSQRCYLISYSAQDSPPQQRTVSPKCQQHTNWAILIQNKSKVLVKAYKALLARVLPDSIVSSLLCPSVTLAHSRFSNSLCSFFCL